MLRMISIPLLLAAALVISGCASPREKSYTMSRDLMREDPEFRRAVIARCISRERNTSWEDRRRLGTIMKVPPNRAVAVYCQRIISAMVDDRLSLRDLDTVRLGSMPPAFLRVLTQG